MPYRPTKYVNSVIGDVLNKYVQIWGPSMLNSRSSTRGVPCRSGTWQIGIFSSCILKSQRNIRRTSIRKTHIDSLGFSISPFPINPWALWEVARQLWLAILFSYTPRLSGTENLIFQDYFFVCRNRCFPDGNSRFRTRKNFTFCSQLQRNLPWLNESKLYLNHPASKTRTWKKYAKNRNVFGVLDKFGATNIQVS